MNDETTLEMFLKLMEELHANTTALKDILANHETRITVLEKDKGGDWKTQLLMLLAKAIVIGSVCVGSLVGAGGVIAKMLGA